MENHKTIKEKDGKNYMTIGEFCDLYIESSEAVTIYSCEAEENVYEGTFYDASFSEYADEEISSFGIENGIICINF